MCAHSGAFLHKKVCISVSYPEQFVQGFFIGGDVFERSGVYAACSSAGRKGLRMDIPESNGRGCYCKGWLYYWAGMA